jgi:hypothetical protein
VLEKKKKSLNITTNSVVKRLFCYELYTDGDAKSIETYRKRNSVFVVRLKVTIPKFARNSKRKLQNMSDMKLFTRIQTSTPNRTKI